MGKSKKSENYKKLAAGVTPPKKQTEIPGTERKRVPEVETAANELREVRTERMELQKTEGQLQDALIDVMRKHSVTVYKFDGQEDELVVELVDQTKVKVRKASTARSEDE